MPDATREETIMNTKPVLGRRDIGTTVVAAALAMVIALGLLAGVANLFLHDGLLLQNVAMAERACRGYSYVSEREACVRWLLAASYVASR